MEQRFLIPTLLCSLMGLTACANDQLIGSAPSAANPLPNKTLVTESTATNHDISFPLWLKQLEADAMKRGIHAPTWQAALPYLKLNPEIIQLDQQQPEFTQTFWTYLSKRMNDLRVQAGKIQQYRYQRLLEQISAEYGLPPEILISFWGLETNYGHYLGNFSTLEALTTLAHDPRRSDFFRKELLAALMIIDQGHISVKNMKGSWAGAIGQVQFMPSVFLKHARDGDNDQKIDLWNSTEDALTSAAAFLKASGWQANVAWGQEVTLPKGFDYALADGQTTYQNEQLQQMGIHPVATTGWRSTTPAQLIVPAGHTGPAFVTYANFAVIKKWNRSTHYALSVGLLADRIGLGQSLSVKAPNDSKPWPRDFTRQLQQRLTDLGYDVGKIDGWLGSNTTRALRQFQQSKGFIADGYPDAQTRNALELRD